MSGITDTFGHAVTDNGDGSFTRDGVTVQGTQDQALTAFNGMAPSGWIPPPPPPVTTISPEDFINRFTAPEQQAILTAAQTNWQVSLWLSKEVASQVLDVTNPAFLAGTQALVAVGLVTADRMAQIVNLALTSP